MPPEAAPGGGLKLGGSRTVLAVLTVLFGLALAFFIFFSKQGVFQIYRLKQERQRLEMENARLAQENERLVRTIDRLHHDPEMIQDLIRRELNFVRKNEIIIQFPEAGPSVPLPPAQEKPPPDAGKNSKSPARAKPGSKAAQKQP